MDKKKRILLEVSGVVREVNSFSGVVNKIYDVVDYRGLSRQDFVVGGIKLCSYGNVLGFEEGDSIRVYYYLEGLVYKRRHIVNLIFVEFEYL